MSLARKYWISYGTSMSMVETEAFESDEVRALRWRTYPRPLLGKSDHASGM
jgi:hypothetical protein